MASSTPPTRPSGADPLPGPPPTDAAGPDVAVTLEAPDAWLVPDLRGVDGVTGVSEPGEGGDVLVTETWDTPDRRLLRAGVWLRRHTGDDVGGWFLTAHAHQPEEWHVERPGDAGGSVPDELATLVRARVRRADLVVVVRTKTRRRTRVLSGPDEAVLATVHDDQATAELLPHPGEEKSETRTWRQLLVVPGEAAADHPAALRRVLGILQDAGAATEGPAVVDRLLRSDAEPPAEAVVREPSASRVGMTADVVLARLLDQRDVVLVLDLDVRREVEDGVHQMRVAVRRSRSALASFRSFFTEGSTEALAEELRWLGDVLGAARDADVLRRRVRRALEAEHPGLVADDLRDWLDDELARAEREALSRAREALDGDRYLDLLDALDAFLADAPLSPRGRRRADEEVPRVLAAEHRRLARRTRVALKALRGAATSGATDPDPLDEPLHEARKAAKRARYAAETAVPALGKRAARLARRWEAVQEVLGERQDSAVTRARLGELAEAATAAGHDALVLGRLHLREERAGRRYEKRLPDVWAAAEKRTVLAALA